MFVEGSASGRSRAQGTRGNHEACFDEACKWAYWINYVGLQVQLAVLLGEIRFSSTSSI